MLGDHIEVLDLCGLDMFVGLLGSEVLIPLELGVICGLVDPLLDGEISLLRPCSRRADRACSRPVVGIDGLFHQTPLSLVLGHIISTTSESVESQQVRCVSTCSSCFDVLHEARTGHHTKWWTRVQLDMFNNMSTSTSKCTHRSLRSRQAIGMIFFP